MKRWVVTVLAIFFFCSSQGWGTKVQAPIRVEHRLQRPAKLNQATPLVISVTPSLFAERIVVRLNLSRGVKLLKGRKRFTKKRVKAGETLKLHYTLRFSQLKDLTVTTVIYSGRKKMAKTTLINVEKLNKENQQTIGPLDEKKPLYYKEIESK